MQVRRIWISLFLYLTVIGLFGQSTPLLSPKLESITIDNGLSQGYVSSILQDRRGFMWFGTLGGLNRYDGYQFKVFRFDPENPYSLSGNNIFALYEDHKGRIWIGTHGQGLNVYDPQSGRVYRVSGNEVSAEHLNALAIKSITQDHLGNIWVGGHSDNTAFGLFRLEFEWPSSANPPATLMGSITEIQLEPDSLVLHNNIYSVYHFKNKLWVGTDWGLYTIDPENTDHSIVCQTPKLATKGTPYSGVYSIRSVDDQLLIGRTGSIQSVDPVNGKVISGNSPVPGDYQATNLSLNAQGQLWYTDYRGMGVRYLPGDSIFQGRKTPKVVFDNVMSVFVDRSDVIWFGMKSTGLYKYAQATNQFNPLRASFTGQQKKYVNQVFEDIHGRLWVNNEILDRKNGSYSKPEFIPESEQFIYLEEDATGRLWGMTAPGKLWCYNTRTNHEEWHDLGPSVSIDGPIHSDKNGVLWWGLAGILHRFDPVQGDLRSYHYNPFASANKVGSFVFALVHDREGLLWIATQQGLIRFDERSGVFKSFRNDPEDPNSLSTNRVLSIHVDQRQPGRYLWLGTEGGGVNRLDRKYLTFDRWTTSDGLSDNTVYSVLEDKNNKLWMSTNHGLSRFDPDKNSFRNYDIGDGLQSNEFNRLAYFRSASGELFFGGVFGLNAFYPEEIEDNSYPPPIAITGFRIGNKPVSVLDSATPLKASISETEEIHLSAHQKMITLEYAALDYTNPGKNQYRYRLEGLQNNWIEAKHNRIATFTNLDPGNYTFHVQGSNNDGLWNYSGTSLRLVIAPPWWRTWWAYALYVVVIFFFAGLLSKIRIRRIRLQSQLAYEQREASRIRELEKLKSRFYSNITHEFRTPLTLILGPVESLLTLEEKDDRREQLINIQQHGQRLLELINQLLDLSKLENNKMVIHWERGDLRQLVHEVVNSFNQAAAQKSINLKQYIPQSFPVFDFDAGKLEKIGRNLLSNALKFTPEKGTIEIYLEYLPNGPNTHWVKWTFKDNGIGIPASELANIFGRFYQVQNEAKPFVEGTGIGLSLCKELSESFGGKITAHSDIGEGSTFTVHIPVIHHQTLPVAPATDQRTRKSTSVTLPHASEIAEEEEEDKLIPEREMVLLIEDHKDLRKFMRSSLTGKYHVIEASNGRAGLETAYKQVPDLIVSDVMMPEMDGYEICQKLKQDERTSHIPVIILTAKASLEDKLHGIEEGADAYLTKPFSPKELEVRIRKLLEGRNLLQQKFSREGFDLTGISVPEGTRDRERVFLAKARDVVVRFIDNTAFDVEDFCREIGMSRTQLHRKLKALTNQSTTTFVRSIRLNVALTMLRQGADNVTEVAYAVGFSSQAYFSKCFQKKFGFPPSQVNAPK